MNRIWHEWWQSKGWKLFYEIKIFLFDSEKKLKWIDLKFKKYLINFNPNYFIEITLLMH